MYLRYLLLPLQPAHPQQQPSPLAKQDNHHSKSMAFRQVEIPSKFNIIPQPNAYLMCRPQPFLRSGHKREDYHTLPNLSNLKPVVDQQSLRFAHCLMYRPKSILRSGHKQEVYRTLSRLSNLKPVVDQQGPRLIHRLTCCPKTLLLPRHKRKLYHLQPLTSNYTYSF